MNIEGVSGNTLAGVVGLSFSSTKVAPVVACWTPMRRPLIEVASTAVPFFTSTPMSEEK